VPPGTRYATAPLAASPTYARRAEPSGRRPAAQVLGAGVVVGVTVVVGVVGSARFVVPQPASASAATRRATYRFTAEACHVPCPPYACNR